MVSKGIRTRQLIIDKSLQLFSVKGYHNTSINNILEATSLTKGGLYGHFSSKEAIWYAVYDEAVRRWHAVVFKGVSAIDDPLLRITKVIENDLMHYLGGHTFDGGCYFLNSLVELSGQSPEMSRHMLRGFIRFSKLFQLWLEEAETKQLISPGLNYREIANFIFISVNGAAALYAVVKDDTILQQTSSQLNHYLQQLKR
ncbi:MAG: TetR/AcrR family transcriptional regulator [Sedimenticola sp.]|nr:TetR/AcrR family transcriptional regulator [Sedimenticola sp.]MCW8947151.1 TetR/AcrR family transcriptional regulator [Sedimenticola sp.]MCW8950496.1 TetR/AcrR family transcriptional regulator [Sedimenticola sp.]MCW8974843.1 TetR/AcrR family transcriptional regulator [Sedimenticola sp.]MDF1530476.1 TetR/AcrR family transcriptional regulator [Sedimenticola sp.]